MTTSDTACTSSSLLSGSVATFDESTFFAGPLEGNACSLELGCWTKGVDEVFDNFCVGERLRIFDGQDPLLAVER